MKATRERGGSSSGGGATTSGGTPGKMTRSARALYGTTRVRRGGAQTGQPMGGAQATPAGGAQADVGANGGATGVENPLSGNGAIQNAPGKPKVTVAFKETVAPALTFNAKDYRELYTQVAARVGKEAGSVTRTPSYDETHDADNNALTVSFTYELATMLPEWTQKATQPAEDQTKFNNWRQSVKDHEAQHRDIYKKELPPALKAGVIGPKVSDIDGQEAAAEATVETKQDAFDASSQPAPLAAPGGIEKVQSAGGPTSDASGPGNGAAPAPGGGAGPTPDGGGAPGAAVPTAVA